MAEFLLIKLNVHYKPATWCFELPEGCWAKFKNLAFARGMPSPLLGHFFLFASINISKRKWKQLRLEKSACTAIMQDGNLETLTDYDQYRAVSPSRELFCLLHLKENWLHTLLEARQGITLRTASHRPVSPRELRKMTWKRNKNS